MTKIRSALALAAGLWLTASALARADDLGASFVDRFDSIDRGQWYVSSGWSNGDYQDCTFQDANVELVPGRGITLTLKEQRGLERPYSCAEIQSTKVYGHGLYEVRMRAAAAPGLVSAFFTYIGPGQKKPHDEIDFEFLGKSRRGVQLNYFVDGKAQLERLVDLGYDAASEVHDYAFDWLADRIVWYVDGREVHRVERAEGKPFPTNPGKICLSIWNGKGPAMASWLAPFAYPGRPLVASYERVAYTRAGDVCQFAGSLACGRRPTR